MPEGKRKPLLTTCSKCGVLYGVAAGRCPVCPTTSLLSALLGTRTSNDQTRIDQKRAAAQMARLVRWDSKQQQ